MALYLETMADNQDHPGIGRACAKARGFLVYKSWKRFQKYIATCPQCLRNNPRRPSPYGSLQSIPTPSRSTRSRLTSLAVLRSELADTSQWSFSPANSRTPRLPSVHRRLDRRRMGRNDSGRYSRGMTTLVFEQIRFLLMMRLRMKRDQERQAHVSRDPRGPLFKIQQQAFQP